MSKRLLQRRKMSLPERQPRSDLETFSGTGRSPVRTHAGGRASGSITDRRGCPGSLGRFMVLVARPGPALVAGQLLLASVGAGGTPVHYCPGGRGFGDQVHHPPPQAGGGLGRFIPENRPTLLPIRTCRPGGAYCRSCPRIGSGVAGTGRLYLGAAGCISPCCDGRSLFVRYCSWFRFGGIGRHCRFANIRSLIM